MSSAARAYRKKWIDEFVQAAADPHDGVDFEYMTMLGEQLYERLRLMRPEDVAAALLAGRSAPLGGLQKKPDESVTTFGVL
ncbi:MAG: hypothetical protein JWQ11_3495, partial [Rhizobacter sp.]|nr:hypothetical protein [Rhizobacter sp.]